VCVCVSACWRERASEAVCVEELCMTTHRGLANFSRSLALSLSRARMRALSLSLTHTHTHMCVHSWACSVSLQCITAVYHCIAWILRCFGANCACMHGMHAWHA